MKRTKIIDVLKSTEYGKDICVKGWVRTHRSSKAVDFIALNDGSTIKNVQIVVDPAKVSEEILKQVTTGACISATGKLVESPAAGQPSEIQAEAIEIYGLCGNDYPMQKKGQSFEVMRKNAHMRLRTNTFGAVMRIRHNMAMAIHTYFHEHGFYYFHTPLITASDCEGAGNMFQVTTKNLYDLKKDEQGKIMYDDDFFGEQTSLTVSGQLEGELGATALGAIYTFGPTFRAENSNTPRHLAEFWMVEPEVAFLDQEELMDLEEDFIKYCVKWALDHCKDDLEFLNKMIDKTLIERLEGVLKETFVRLPYTEGINIPPQMGLIHLTAFNLTHQFVVAFLTDRTTDNLADLREQHIGALHCRTRSHSPLVTDATLTLLLVLLHIERLEGTGVVCHDHRLLEVLLHEVALML